MLTVDAGMPKLFHVCFLNEYREVRVLNSELDVVDMFVLLETTSS